MSTEEQRIKLERVSDAVSIIANALEAYYYQLHETKHSDTPPSAEALAGAMGAAINRLTGY